MRRIATTIAGAALAALCAAAPARAEEVNGSAVIDDVLAVSNAVVLDGTQYRVSDSTRLEDEQGGPLTLPELPSLAGGATVEQAAAWYEADEPVAGAPRQLRVLRLTGAMPK